MPKMIRTVMSAFIMALAVIAMLGSAALSQELSLTTNSAKAREFYLQARTELENFQFQQFGATAKLAVAADSNFAMAHMVVAAATPRNQSGPIVEKFMTLASKASKGEQRYLQGMKHYYDNQTDQALEVFTALSKDFPGDRGVQMMTGQLCRGEGKVDEAIAYFQVANKIDASTPRATAYIGDCLVLKEDYAGAQKYYKEALAKVDNDASPFGPFFGMAMSQLYQKNPDGALAITTDYMSRYNRNGAAQGFPPVWIWNWQARVNLEYGRLEAAMKCYETGYKSVPPSQLDSLQKVVWEARKYHGKARTLAKMGKHAEAWQIAENLKKQLDAAGEEGEQYLEAWHYLAGYLKLESGDFKAAKEHLEQADQNNSFHKLLLARAALKLGEPGYAVEICEDIVKSTNLNLERALSYNEAKDIIKKYASN